MTDYHVAVHLSLAGNLAQALAIVTSHMAGIRTHQRAIEDGFRAWRPAIMGFVGIFTSGLIVKGLYDIASASDKVSDEMARMAMQGQKVADIKKNWDEAFNVAIKTGRPVAGVMEELTKMSYYTANVEEARALIEKITKMETILHAVTGRAGEGQVTPLLKVLEEVGILGNKLREGDLNKILEGLTRDITATRGTVSPAQIAQNILYARAARFEWLSPEALAEEHPFVTTVLPYLIQSYGGVGRGGAAGPGAALMSMFTKNVQGTLSKKSAHEAAFLGLLEGGAKFGHLKGAEEYARNPYEWVQKYLMPALMAKGIDTQAGIIQEVSKLYGTRMAADPAIAMSLLGPKRFEQLGLSPGMAKWFSPMERHMRLQDQAKGIEDAMKEVWTMPTMLKDRISNAWGNLWVAIGQAARPEFVNILARIAEAIEGVAKAAKAMDPNAIVGVGTALLGLAAGIATLSTLALGAGVYALVGPMGLLAGIGAALVAMSPKVHQALKDLGEAMGEGDMEKIKAAGAKLAWSMVSALDDAADDAAKQLHDLVVSKFRSIWDNIMQTLGFGGEAAALPGHPLITMPGGTPIPQGLAPWHERSPWFKHWTPEGIERFKQQLPTIEPMPLIPSPFGSAQAGPRMDMPGMPAAPAPNIIAPPMPSPLPWDWKHNFPMPPSLSAPSPQSFQGGIPGAGSMLRTQPWEPGGGQGGTAQVNNVIYLDGQAIARAVHDYQMGAMQHPTQAAYFNGREGFTTPDWQPVFA